MRVTRRLLKLVHELGAIGITGALVAHMVLLATASQDSLVEYAAVREGIAAISRYLLVPSLAIVLVSGLFAMAAQPAFFEMRWVWAKALLGLPTFEGTLTLVDSTAQRAARLSAEAAAGEADPALLAELLRNEWAGLWWILVLVVASTVLGVWRPKLRGKRLRSRRSAAELATRRETGEGPRADTGPAPG